MSLLLQKNETVILFDDIYSRCVQNREQCMNILKNFSMTLEVPEVSEDCLYLNIYTPAKPSEDAKLPVSLYLH